MSRESCPSKTSDLYLPDEMLNDAPCEEEMEQIKFLELPGASGGFSNLKARIFHSAAPKPTPPAYPAKPPFGILNNGDIEENMTILTSFGLSNKRPDIIEAFRKSESKKISATEIMTFINHVMPPKKANDLIYALKFDTNHHIQDIVKMPFLLRMICWMLNENDQFGMPKNKRELFDQFFEFLISKSGEGTFASRREEFIEVGQFMLEKLILDATTKLPTGVFGRKKIPLGLFEKLYDITKTLDDYFQDGDEEKQPFTSQCLNYDRCEIVLDVLENESMLEYFAALYLESVLENTENGIWTEKAEPAVVILMTNIFTLINDEEILTTGILFGIKTKKIDFFGHTQFYTKIKTLFEIRDNMVRTGQLYLDIATYRKTTVQTPMLKTNIDLPPEVPQDLSVEKADVGAEQISDEATPQMEMDPDNVIDAPIFTELDTETAINVIANDDDDDDLTRYAGRNSFFASFIPSHLLESISAKILKYIPFVSPRSTDTPTTFVVAGNPTQMQRLGLARQNCIDLVRYNPRHPNSNGNQPPSTGRESTGLLEQQEMMTGEHDQNGTANGGASQDSGQRVTGLCADLDSLMRRSSSSSFLVDTALFTANFSRMLSVLRVGHQHPHFVFMIVLLSISMILQAAIACILIWSDRRNLNHSNQPVQNKVSRCVTVLMIISVLLNLINIMSAVIDSEYDGADKDELGIATVNEIDNL